MPAFLDQRIEELDAILEKPWGTANQQAPLSKKIQKLKELSFDDNGDNYETLRAASIKL